MARPPSQSNPAPPAEQVAARPSRDPEYGVVTAEERVRQEVVLELQTLQALVVNYRFRYERSLAMLVVARLVVVFAIAFALMLTPDAWAIRVWLSAAVVYLSFDTTLAMYPWLVRRLRRKP